MRCPAAQRLQAISQRACGRRASKHRMIFDRVAEQQVPHRFCRHGSALAQEDREIEKEKDIQDGEETVRTIGVQASKQEVVAVPTFQLR
jgi:hypothetical protein